MITATEAELGWFAGMLEGEGCVTFFKQPRKNGKFDIIVGLQVTNTDINIINKLVDILNKCELSWFLRNKKVYSKNHNECFYVETRQQAMLRKSLEIFIPYMYGSKKSKASLVLDFLIKRDGKRGNRPYTEDELSIIPRDYTSSAQAAEDIVHTI
jgi:hypothetical protein